MPSLSPQSQAVLDSFAQSPGVTVDHVQNLSRVLRDSPVLMDQFNAAVAQGHLQHIVPLSNPHAGGEYNGQFKEMRFPLASLAPPPHGSNFNAGEVTFVLGHELQHGLNSANQAQATREFVTQATRVARSQETTHDYTAAIGDQLAANRRDEAGAEIAGWNAIVSAVKASNPNPTLEDIYKKANGRTRDFIDENAVVTPPTYSLKSNLSLNHDLTMSPTPANIEAMGQNYFDKTAQQSALGFHGDSDYVNYYGANAISYVAQLERHYNPPQHGTNLPRMTVDMTALRLSERLMEENGIDLGRNTLPMPYMDRSTVPPTLHHFDHTAATHTYVPILAQEISLRLDDPMHPGHAMFRQSMDEVQQLNAKHGVPPDSVRDANLSGSLTVAAAAQGLSHIDQVVLSDDAKYAFAIRDHHISELPDRWAARVETVQAIHTPLAQSSEQWSQAVQQRDQGLTEQRAQQQAWQQSVSAPSMGYSR